MGERKHGMTGITVEGRIVQTLVGRHPPVTLREKRESPDGAYLVSTPQATICANLEGIEGDRHAGWTRKADARVPFYPRGTVIRNTRQVSLVSIEELAEMAAALGLPIIEPSWIGANLAIIGVPRFSRLPPLTRLFFPDTCVLVLEGENHPCVFPGKALQAANPGIPGLVKSFPNAARHRRGLVSWVERAGTIRTGDTVRIVVPEQHTYASPETP